MFANTSALRRETAASDRRSRLPGRTLLAALLLAAAATAGASGTDQSPPPELVEMPSGDLLSRVSAPGQATLTPGRPAANLPVGNCNNGGTGSLRSVIIGAADGDIVDLSGLTCGPIELTSPLLVMQNNLTIQGKSAHPDASPVSIIDGRSSVQVLRHSGNGILQLKDLWLRNGLVQSSITGGNPGDVAPARGGCVQSAGSVLLQDSLVSDCEARDSITHTVAESRGGAIHAVTSVGAVNTILRGNRVIAHSATVSGGAIWANDVLALVDSVLEDNFANSGTGSAAGGGAFAGQQLLLDSSIVHNNRVRTDTGRDGDGGGILLDGSFAPANTLSIVANSQFTDNRAEGLDSSSRGNGGGLLVKYHPTNTVMVADSTFHGNQAKNLAGGLRSDTRLLLLRSTIAENTADIGGGVLASLARIEDSTIADNEAGAVGGAYLGAEVQSSESSPVYVIQSTISGNRATESVWGAGLSLAHKTEIWNSTITANTETGPRSVGAGVTLHQYVPVVFRSSIVAGNRWRPSDSSHFEVSDVGSQNAAHGSVQGEVNLIGGLKDVSILLVNGYENVIDPLLEPLADNGGPTWTHLPKATSLAVDHGAANGYAEDQRGAGYPRVIGLRADIGAVERGEDRIFRNGFDND